MAKRSATGAFIPNQGKTLSGKSGGLVGSTARTSTKRLPAGGARASTGGAPYGGLRPAR